MASPLTSVQPAPRDGMAGVKGSKAARPVRVQRAAAVALALSGVYVGVWAAGFPESFYRSFPGLHRTWVSVDGPYNEHLVRDVGSLYLGLATVAAGAALSRTRFPRVVAGAAWTVFSALHLLYHSAHLADHGPLDRVANVVVLVATLLAAVALMLPITSGE